MLLKFSIPSSISFQLSKSEFFSSFHESYSYIFLGIAQVFIVTPFKFVELFIYFFNFLNSLIKFIIML